MNAHIGVPAIDWVDELFKDAMESLRPAPPYTVSEWADRHRKLSSKSSPEPGQWRTSRTPYLREIMDCLSVYSPVQTVAVMKGVQIGMSEGGFNFVGYVIDHAPGPMMYVMPTITMMKKFSKIRIDPMIEASPSLRDKVGTTGKSRDSGNTIEQKDFTNGVLVMSGANSGASLRGIPVRYLVLDEVDGYPAVADDDGDPVTLAMDRTNAHSARRKIFKLSTPLLKESSRIGPAFREGDQRYYNVKCDKCGTLQPITWDRIKWESGKPETAVFVCSAFDAETGELCEHRHPEHRKAHLLSEENGACWIPTAVPVNPKTRSYHLSALYSPWYSWASCAERFLEVKDDPAKLQPFINNVLGEEWEALGGEKLDPDSLLAKRETFEADPLPEKVALLTCGVDVQPDRLELEVVGWGRDEESWSIAYHTFAGDPSELEVWDQLDDFLSGRFAHPAKPDGLRISATCIDTGGANTQDAYRFIRPREGRRIWGIKGYAGKRPVWPKRPNRNNKGKINLYAIGVDAAKEVVTARLTKMGPQVSGAGACHFNMDRDKEYFEQLTVERKVTRYVKGFKVIEWHKNDHDRNEAFDCRVYAYAALQGLVVGGINLNKRAKAMAEELAEKRRDSMPEEPEAVEPVAVAPEETKGAAEVDASQNRGMTTEERSAITRRKRKRGRVIASPFMG
ncbi:phage terminase large subunit family protein [Rhizobium sp. 1AS11]|uniref:phage terminase large subunit family protein n=1 Tax=Rhizobium acaciae TaxID=2989736 RepID=UPI002222DEE0|nr:phage terminase large subunit family protein [Rhizobium acaciae]MCW1412200.1 phage terminase large subunit family protein [Rhizobium acaciae]MCW1744215.1 phage terminase large subunit family protein [Rhizobium acaciae]